MNTPLGIDRELQIHRRFVRSDFLQCHHTLEMLRLRKQIKGLNSQNPVSLFYLFEIPYLSRRVTTHIDHTLRSKCHQLRQKLRTAPLARRINHHRSLSRIEIHLGEDVGRVAL